MAASPVFQELSEEVFADLRNDQHLMSALDYLILTASIVGVTVVGLIASRRRKATIEQYFMADRSVHWLAVTATLIATGISAKSLIGLPGLAYMGDLTYMQLYLPVPIAVFIVTVVFLPFYSRLKVISAYEYLGMRFGNRTRSFASLLYQLEYALVLGTVIAAPSLVMSEAVGVRYELCILIMLVLTVVYTSIGGMKAVIWTDVLQMGVFIVVPLIVLAYVLSSSVGDYGALFNAAQAHQKLKMFDLSFVFTDRITLWAGFASMLVYHISNYGCSQTLIQRYMTARSQKESRRSIIVSGFGLVFIWITFLMMGTLLFAYNQLHPDTIPDGTHGDRVFTAFVMKALPNGLRGLFIAAAFAAGMSTLSSILHSMGTVTLLDVWKLHSKTPASEETWVNRARWLTLMWGVVSFASALFVLQLGTVITAGIKMGSVIGGTLLGIFLLGIFVRRAVAQGVIVGAVLSLGTLIGFALMSDVHWAWYCAIAMTVTVVYGSVISLLFPRAYCAEELTYRSFL